MRASRRTFGPPRVLASPPEPQLEPPPTDPRAAACLLRAQLKKFGSGSGSSSLSGSAPTVNPADYTPRMRSRGQLKVHLKRGVGLKSADRNGKSDPYVIVRCGGAEKRSRVVPRTLDPEWDETLEFEGTACTPSATLPAAPPATRVAMH